MSIEKKHQPLEFTCCPDNMQGAAWEIIYDSNKALSVNIRKTTMSEGFDYPIEVLAEIVDFLRKEGRIKPPEGQNLIRTPNMQILGSPITSGSSLHFPEIQKKDRSPQQVQTAFAEQIDPISSFDITVPIITRTKDQDIEQEQEQEQDVPQANDVPDGDEISPELEAELKSRQVIRSGDMKDPVHGGDMLRSTMIKDSKKIKRADD